MDKERRIAELITHTFIQWGLGLEGMEEEIQFLVVEILLCLEDAGMSGSR